MLYNWSGAPYRSKQADVCPVVVRGFWTIIITHNSDGRMVYDCGKESGPPLFESEGFSTQEEMDDWFRPLIERSTGLKKTLMLFALAKS